MRSNENSQNQDKHEQPAISRLRTETESTANEKRFEKVGKEIEKRII